LPAAYVLGATSKGDGYVHGNGYVGERTRAAIRKHEATTHVEDAAADGTCQPSFRSSSFTSARVCPIAVGVSKTEQFLSGISWHNAPMGRPSQAGSKMPTQHRPTANRAA
jgi:hypothetical protein